MGIGTGALGRMTSEEIVALNREHTFFSWSVQGAIDPIAIDRAEGVYLYTPEGQRILDFNSQLMSVNIGHGDRRVIDAITEQALKLQYVQPAFATEIRARLGQKLAEILPGDIDKVFFTLGGAEAIENAIKLARHSHRPVQGPRPLPRLPRRHVRGDDADRRPAPLGERAGPRRRRPLSGHAPLGEKEPRPVAESLQGLEDVIRYEGAHTIAAVFLETIVGTNGILIPPDGYLEGVREICDRQRHPHGLRRGHGRLRPDRPLVRRRPLGRGPGPDDDGQGPDELVPAARRGGDAPRDRRGVRDEDVLRRPHVLVAPGEPRRGARDDPRVRGGRPHRQRASGSGRSCAATTNGSPRSTRRSARRATSGCSGSSISSGPGTRGRRSTPFNGTSDEMKAIGKFFRENGLYTCSPTTRSTRTRRCASPRSSSPTASRSSIGALDIADQAVTG